MSDGDDETAGPHFFVVMAGFVFGHPQAGQGAHQPADGRSARGIRENHRQSAARDGRPNDGYDAREDAQPHKAANTGSRQCSCHGAARGVSSIGHQVVVSADDSNLIISKTATEKLINCSLGLSPGLENAYQRVASFHVKCLSP
jgi:hypothetical protein